MSKKLERIFEYRVLLAKAGELSIPLTAEEEVRLDRLAQQLPMAVPPLDDRDPYTLLSEPLPADFVQSGRFQPCTIRNASGTGLALATVDPPPLEQRVLIHVRDPRQPVEYTFPARVISRVVRGLCGMSVAFEGVPTLRRLSGRSSGVWSTEDATPTTRIRVGKNGR